MANYRIHNREQIEMRMMCINDSLPEDHDARKLVKIIEQMDLSLFDSFYCNDNDAKPAYPIQPLILGEAQLLMAEKV